MKKSSKLSYMQKHYFKTANFSNLKEMLYSISEKYSSKPAFILKDNMGYQFTVSYYNFVKDVESVGLSLINHGFLNKKIALVGANSYKWAVSYLAASIVGVVVPIDKELHSDDIINFLNISEASVILGDDKNLSEIFNSNRKLNKKITYINFDLKSNNDIFYSFDAFKSSGLYNLENNNKFKDIQIDSDELHFLLFTSGTTGNSKGVCLSHRNICSNIFSVGSIVKVDCSTSILSILPMHHTYECTLGFLLVVANGGTISFCEGFRKLSNNFVEYSPSIILSVPLLLEKLHKKIMKSLADSLPEKYFKKNKHIMDCVPFFMKPIIKHKILKSLGGRLKKIIVGASAIDPELLNSLEKFGFTVLSGYGLTECSPLVAGNNDFFHKADSVGLPIPNVEFVIDSPNSDGIGEILVKGPNVMLGYYKNDEATKATFKGDYFKTGDLGKIDDDGFLYICGRAKSVIITKNGKNVYPEELEEILNKNDYIEESLVSGNFNEEHKDTEVSALIVLNMDNIKKKFKKPTKDDISKLINSVIKTINDKLPNFKHIKNYAIKEDSLEKTTTQKVKRFGKNLEDLKNRLSKK